jgi:ribosomal protein S12 methylthiotransferase accessory factor
MSNLRREKAYKLRPPMATINHARSILERCDLFVQEYQLRYQVNGISCCRIWLGDEDVEGLSVGTNGKGMNARYSLASGYAEMMERLENGSLYPMRQRKFALLNQGGVAPEAFRQMLVEEKADLLYQFSPDERWLTADELIAESRDIVAEMFGIEEADVPAFLQQALEEGTTPCTPFWSVFEKKTRLIPMELLWRVCGSNGMCAGNGPWEAIIQGLSEIFERYAFRLIYEENLIPPIVPPETFSGTDVLKRLEAMTEDGLDYEIRDCSMGIGLPVMGLSLINRENGKRAFHLGADPSPLTALERCLAELFQGRPEINSTRYYAQGAGVKPKPDAGHAQRKAYYHDYQGMIISGNGAGPDCVREVGEPFKGFDHPISSSDKDDFDYLLHLVEKLGKKLYIRDNSYLGFPAYHLYIPDASEINFIFNTPNHEDLLTWTRVAKEQNTYLNLPGADEQALKRLADALKALEEAVITDDFQPTKWFFSCEELPLFARDLHAFSAVLYGCTGLFTDAVKHMESYLASDASAQAPRRLCMAMCDYWMTRAQGDSPETAQVKLAIRYGDKLADKAAHWHFSADEWPTCFDCENCGVRKTCRFVALCRRQRVPQEQMAMSPVDQTALCALFKEKPC